MTSIAIDPHLVAAQAIEANLASPLARRLLELFTPLLEAEGPRQFQTTLDQAVVDYMPFKFIVAFALASKAQEEGKTLGDATREVNQEVFSALAESGHSLFAPGDRKMLLAAFRWLSRIGRVGEQVLKGHKEAFTAAFVDGFWALQKADVCLSTAIFVSRRQLPLTHAKAAHWLCLALRRSQQEFDDAVFANNPELMKRLATPSKTITNSELERRLGL